MPFLALSLLLLISVSGAQPQAPAYREYETSSALARIALITQGGSDSVAHDSAAIDSAADGISLIDDFTSLPQIDRAHEALLEAYLVDKFSGTELRFPLKYSQARDYLLLHPLDFQSGSTGERNIALLQALAGDLHVRMLETLESGGKE